MMLFSSPLSFVLFSLTCVNVLSQPLVTVEQGDLQGETILFKEDAFINVEKEIDIFRGIPFAEPPVDELRFKAPVTRSPWNGVWNATYDRPICWQGEYKYTSMLEKDEDCLYLAVYAPNPKPENAAVLFWIHGGGFSNQAGSMSQWYGAPLVATGDVIVVTINYRLGAFGFLTTGDDISPGNYGLLDQVEALKWVQKNIHAFGGDPDKVTLFGDSAGAVSVDLHTYSPVSLDLFNTAIIESGSASQFTTNITDAREAAFQLDETFGCNAVDSSQILLDCLRDVPAQELLAATAYNFFLNKPSVDGVFLEDTPVNLMAKQQFKRTSILLGNNADESAFFLGIVHPPFPPTPFPPPINRQQYDTFIADFMAGNGYTSDIMVEQVNQVYIDWKLADDPSTDYLDTWIAALSDYDFICNMDLVARAHASVGDTVFQYHYTQVSSMKDSPQWTGATHTDELQYVWGWAFNPMLPDYLDATDDEKRLAVNVMKYWANFAKYGDPNIDGVDDDLKWPMYNILEKQYKEINVDLANGRGLKADQCHLWNQQLPQLATFVGDLSAVEQEWREDFNTWKYDDMQDWRQEFNKYKEDTQL